MKRSQFSGAIGLAAMCIALFAACGSPVGSAIPGNGDPTATTGSITGKAKFSNATDNAGILVFAETVSGTLTSSVRAALSSGTAARAVDSSAIAAQTTTSADGSYALTGLAAGTYTVYAVSNDTLERAVSGVVTVAADTASTLNDLILTATGSVSGTVNWDGSTTGNGNVLVYIAGTNYMAYTNDAGTFKISGVPAASSYQLCVVYKETNAKKVVVEKNLAWKTVSVIAKQDTVAGTYDRSPGFPSETEHVKVASDPSGVKFTVKLPPKTSIIVYDQATNTRYCPDIYGMDTYTFVYPLVAAGNVYKFRVQFNGTDFNDDSLEYNEYVTCSAGGGLGPYFDYADSSYTQLKVAYVESGDKRIITLQNWPNPVDTLPAFVIGDRTKIVDYYINLEFAIGPVDWSNTVWFYGRSINISDATLRTEFFTNGADLMNLDVFGSNWRDATAINEGLAYKKFFCDAMLYVKLSGYGGYFGSTRFGTNQQTYTPVKLTED